jgi:hypothetical protein
MVKHLAALKVLLHLTFLLQAADLEHVIRAFLKPGLHLLFFMHWMTLLTFLLHHLLLPQRLIRFMVFLSQYFAYLRE